MKADDALVELLARIGASHDGAVFVDAVELADWPKGAVAALKDAGLLAPAAPAASVECDGCEQRCFMPVEIAAPPGRTSRAFIACDKRNHIARVDVPLARLERWQASGEAVAALLARLLSIHRSASTSPHPKQWEVGVLRDKHASQVALIGDDSLVLELAGHSVPLVDVFSLTGKTLSLQRQKLLECVNHPVAGGGTRESAAQRRKRIAARCEALFRQGQRNFRRIAAAEEGCAVETIKDILAKAGFSTRGLPRMTKDS